MTNENTIKVAVANENVLEDIGNEIVRYIYHKDKSYGKWDKVKQLCKWSYAVYDTDYIGDMLDDKLYNGSLFNLELRDDETMIIRSYEYMYKNVKSITIEYTDKVCNKDDTLSISGPEMFYFLENFKVPVGNKRVQSMYSYLKSFIIDSYPKSFITKSDYVIKEIDINLSDSNSLKLNELF